MLEGIINTQPTSYAVLGRLSTLASSLILTFEQPYGPSSQVDIRLNARVDNRPRTPSSVGFVYVCYRPILANGLLWSGDQHRISLLHRVKALIFMSMSLAHREGKSLFKGLNIKCAMPARLPTPSLSINFNMGHPFLHSIVITLTDDVQCCHLSRHINLLLLLLLHLSALKQQCTLSGRTGGYPE